MIYRDKIQFELVKLVGGERLLRVVYPPLGLALEKKVDPSQAVLTEKKRLLDVFDAALAKAELNAA